VAARGNAEPGAGAVERPAAGGAGGRRGLSAVVQSGLVGLLAVTWLFNLLFGPVEVALPLFVGRDLDGGAGLLGAYWALFGAGAVVGALASGAARRLPLWPVVLGIIGAHGLLLLPFAVHPCAVPSLAGFAAAGVVYGPYSTLSLNLVQERAPAAQLTAVLAARSAVLLTGSPVGAVLGGVLLTRAGPAAMVAASGGAMALLAAVSALVLCARSRGGRRRP
jgi:hypothetical protein